MLTKEEYRECVKKYNKMRDIKNQVNSVMRQLEAKMETYVDENQLQLEVASHE